MKNLQDTLNQTKERCCKICFFGKQAQFDWKEKLKFSFKSGEEFIFNVGSLILSASRFKYWAICPSTSQAYLFDFLTNVFEALGGVPKEIPQTICSFQIQNLNVSCTLHTFSYVL